ncbi:MAG TPA: sugar transferase, partial [Micromonospora sp.]
MDPPLAHRKPVQRAVKRIVDVLLAVLLLVAGSPVLALALLLLRLDLGRPLIFVQERTGRGMRPFRLYKLRCMVEERDADGRLTGAVRCAGIGCLLRRLSIDELPQLVNVIRGELSLIGPRPLLPRYDPWYTERERARFSVRPGLTGLAQVAGRTT